MNKSDNQQINVTFLNDGMKINVKVIPNSSKCEVAGIIDNNLRIKLDVPPIEGKANEKCIKFLSKVFGVSKSSISIVLGDKNKNKVLLIKGDVNLLKKKLDEILD